MENEINELVKSVKNGDSSSFESLCVKYSPLISKEVSAFVLSGAGVEGELYDEAKRALLSAAVTFDFDKGVGFGYYAKICIRNALITVRRSVLSKERKKNKTAEIKPQKRRKRNFEAFEGLSDSEIIEKIETVLSEYEAKVFLLHLEGKKSREVGELVGKSERSVNNAIFRARQKIREM